VWLVRLVLPIWRELRKIAGGLDKYDFEKLVREFLQGEKPIGEDIRIKMSEKREEGYREISITRVYRKPLDVKETWQRLVRQLAEELQ